MTGKAFRQAVKKHPDLVLVEVRGTFITIGNKKKYATHTFPFSEIMKHPWEEWLALFMGLRGSRLMIQLSRVVGYYSRVDNWNRSKQAELKDRHGGDYALAEPA